MLETLAFLLAHMTQAQSSRSATPQGAFGISVLLVDPLFDDLRCMSLQNVTKTIKNALLL